MSHEVESMMYAKELPWHGLGKYVGDESILAEEAIIAAGLDWHVEKAPAFAAVTVGETEREIPSDEWFFNVRTSDMKVLGAVKDRYSILQNKNAFEFMDRLAGPGNLVRYHTAGSLHGGKVVWMLAELVGLHVEPVPGDRTDPYLLLMNGHDGSTPVKCLFTSVRVVCQNTLNLALGSSKGGVTIRHSGKMGDKLSQAREILGLATKEVEKYSELAEQLALKKMGDKVFEQFLDHMFPLEEDKNNARRHTARDSISALAEAGPGADIAGVRGTAWGALQAVTNYTSHHMSVRGGGDDPLVRREKRMQSVWAGTANSVNAKALDYLSALV